MAMKCCVPGCTSTDAIKSLFSYPKHDLNLLDEWINEIPNLDINQLDLDFSCVCEDHFKPEEVIIRYHDIKELVAGAIPLIFDCVEINLEACRFCLKIKNVGDRLTIDETVKGEFFKVMDCELDKNPELPGIICIKCKEELKSAANLIYRIKKSQTRISNLLERKIIKEEIEDVLNSNQVTDTNEIKREPECVLITRSSTRSGRSSTKRKIPSKDTSVSRKLSRSALKKHEKPCFTVKRTYSRSPDAKLTLEADNSDKISKKICAECGEKFNNKQLQEHIESTHLQPGNHCHICNLSISEETEYKQHVFTKHFGITYLKKDKSCSECNKKFSSNYGLNRHLTLYHSKEENEKIKLEGLLQHRRDYMNEKIPCQICGQLVTRQKFKRHQMRLHNVERLFVCDICGERRCLKYEIRRHMETKHVLVRDKFKCPHCVREFFRKDNYNEHVNAVHFKIVQVCELCGLSFSTLVKYQNHVRLKHTFEKPFSCNECEKAYATSSCLSEHKRRAHTEPIPCTSCLKVFPSADSLSRHFKLTHREKKFACEFEGCGKKFANPSLLKNHTFVHSEQKKFQCKLCPHSYYKGPDLNRHIKAAHMNIKLPCQVSGCSSVFTRKDTLRYHIKSQHKNIDPNYIQMLLNNLRDKRLPTVQELENQND